MRFGRSVFEDKSSVLGQTVRLDGTNYQIVGVMPAGFEFPHSSDLPAALDIIDGAQLVGFPPHLHRSNWPAATTAARLQSYG